MNLYFIAQNAKEAQRVLAKQPSGKKEECLIFCADELESNVDYIISENEKDMAEAEKNGMSSGLKDRLKLNADRIKAMADGLRTVARLDDPIGEVTGMKKRPNGLLIGQVRVPLGVVGIIYEARPNVTADAFALCFKTGNAVILKGGSDAINSNIAIVNVLRGSLEKCGIPADAVSLITDTSRETATEFMKMEGYQPDKIIVALGTNQYGSPTMDAVEEYYETLMSIYGNEIPVLCISPLWRGDNPEGIPTLERYCENIKKIAGSYGK